LEEERPDEMEMAEKKDEKGEEKEKNEEKNMNIVSEEKILKYFDTTRKALEKARESGEKLNIKESRGIIIRMVEDYVSDAEHFYRKKDLVNAFAALNYAHGWLDCGASLGIFDVHDSSLFTAD